MKKLIIVLVIVVAAGLIWMRFFKKTAVSPTTSPSATSSLSKPIRVDSVRANDIITSPLIITGAARGTWYFEASFPIKLLDGNGKVIAQIPAQAQSDWMTTNFVPFEAELLFNKPVTPTGTLVLEKDNPSGLPQNADELRIPIRFK